MMNPADHPQRTASQRSAESPTLWLSLALGSVCIHLVLFILASIVSTQTAKVQVELEPVAVEFVDPAPTTVRSTARAIAARPGTPSSTRPSSTQAQPNISPRSSSLNQPIEQPFVPLPPVKRKLTPSRPRPQLPTTPYRKAAPQQSSPTIHPGQPQPTPFPPQPSQPQPTPFPPQPSRPNPSQTQSEPGTNPSPGGLTGSDSNPTPQPSGTQPPATSDQPIAQLPQGRSVLVVVFNPRQVIFDRQQQPASPIEQQKTVAIDYSDAIAQIPGHSIRIEVTLQIDNEGGVIGVEQPSLLSPEGAAIDPADLNYMAKKIFETWKFRPAKNVSGLTPPTSNLMIDAQIQFP